MVELAQAMEIKAERGAGENTQELIVSGDLPFFDIREIGGGQPRPCRPITAMNGGEQQLIVGVQHVLDIGRRVAPQSIGERCEPRRLIAGRAGRAWIL